MKNLSSFAAALILMGIATTTAPHAAYAQNKPMNDHMGQLQMMELGKTGKFKGVEVNGGFATLYKMDNKFHLKWSDDFKIPGTPAPSWQVVDAQGNTYLLQQLKIAGDKQNRDIVLPSYIKSVAKVQIWCSFAEVNLGEASFAKAMTLAR
ncbi:MAG: hypothetical protein JSS71_05545 [Armatimonadetes bacterium]|nr:hypothetical protein [Armatimonadota bacterium]MBX3108845.1 hypothetical protein [Fimbriimonadaceae bacterium]